MAACRDVFPRICSQLVFDKVYRDKMGFDLREMCVLCTEESASKTLGRASGGNWGEAQRTTVCHLEERQDVQFKSAGKRCVMREAWASFPCETEGETRGTVDKRQVRMALRERSSEKGVLIKK